MLGAVALMAGTAVVALANYVEGISLTGNCVDTYTSGTVSTLDAQTGHVLELEFLAYNGTTHTWTSSTSPIAKVDIDLVNNKNSYTWWIQVPQTYLSSPYTKWEVQYDPGSSSGITGPGSSYSAPVSSTLCSPDPNTPEAPLAVGLPLAGLAIFAGAFGFEIRRRRHSASAV
jgi:hypothetical protein